MAKKSAKRTTARGGINFNLIKGALEVSVRNLEKALKEQGHGLSPKRRLHYEHALLNLKIGHTLVKKVDCDGPFMTFELLAEKGRARSAK